VPTRQKEVPQNNKDAGGEIPATRLQPTTIFSKVKIVPVQYQ